MRVALTGGIGSGKSTVAGFLAERGAVIVDADAIAREIVEPGQPALEEIVKSFGARVLRPDGRLDRGALAQIVFADPQALARLNAITHPRIATLSAQRLDAVPADAVVVYDMPLLAEQGPAALQGWDAIVVVDAPEDLRVSRLVTRGLSADDAQARVQAQASREARLAIATHVLDNSGSESGLRAQVDALWNGLNAPGA
ncbi:MAG: dephospho-CoA kinase, long form [Actinomycetales bacterium]|nr:dephospho-CoA kinase, long form [Actinomycetales bacterium]